MSYTAWKCQRCGNHNDELSPFCEKCGVDIPDKEKTRRFREHWRSCIYHQNIRKAGK